MGHEAAPTASMTGGGARRGRGGRRPVQAAPTCLKACLAGLAHRSEQIERAVRRGRSSGAVGIFDRAQRAERGHGERGHDAEEFRVVFRNSLQEGLEVQLVALASLLLLRHDVAAAVWVAAPFGLPKRRLQNRPASPRALGTCVGSALKGKARPKREGRPLWVRCRGEL